MSATSRARVLCLGHEFMADDSAAVRLGRRLLRTALPDGATVQILPALSIDLLADLSRDEALLVVDALSCGMAPGTCGLLPATDFLATLPAPRGPLHGLTLAGLLSLGARLLGEQMPDDISVVFIEARDLGPPGAPLSPPVRRALPRACGLVRAWLRDRCQAGPRAARRA